MLMGMTTQEDTEQLHATCIALGADTPHGAQGVLLRGPSGAGKSDLALRLIDAGALLVADDRVDVFIKGGVAFARAPANIAGLMEVRGVGVVRLEHIADVRIALCVDLVHLDAVTRLPEAETVEIAGVPIRRLALDPFAVSTPAKIRLALHADPLDPDFMVSP